eukprot:CAMPEP_0202856924 /NCGR_PEP_ID=MMETSP1391-20130828/42_1 /ASSEMBLY_ACC=CAM_ASM_000867 /TAXON_ID=1034604 /ORGANISM="Chlamydomonas leiostraca, Strain SAG 11-49" /LENGTH=96 /DNA_ID=CAMNT_0049535641 /DNA_START=385 /DNA_END=676 /DNA_ORIENTATION=-
MPCLMRAGTCAAGYARVVRTEWLSTGKAVEAGPAGGPSQQAWRRVRQVHRACPAAGAAQGQQAACVPFPTAPQPGLAWLGLGSARVAAACPVPAAQ